MAPAAAHAVRKVPFPTILAFAMPSVTLAGAILVFGVYLPRFYVGLGVDLVAVGLAIAVVRFVDVWFDPFLGIAMDRTRTPGGRYRVWMVLGAPILMIGAYKVLTPGVAAGAGYLTLWLLVSYLGYSILTLSTVAWTGVLSGDYHERSRVYGWVIGIAVLGAIGLLLLPKITRGAVVLGKAASMPTIALILVVAIPLAVLVCAVFTPEPISEASRARFSLGQLRSAIVRPEMIRLILADLALSLGTGATAPLYVFFFHDAKGFTVAEVGFLLIFYIGASLIGAPFWGRVARATGKHRALQIACVCYAIAQSSLMATPRVWPGHGLAQLTPTIVGMFAVGFTASAFLLLVRAMVADVVDEVRLETGSDITSLLFSLVTTTNKIGLAITVTIAYPILKLVGYNGREGAVNTPHAIFGLEMCYLFAPVILVFLGGGAFFGYRLDAKRHTEIRAGLAERDSGQTPAEPESIIIGVA